MQHQCHRIVPSIAAGSFATGSCMLIVVALGIMGCSDASDDSPTDSATPTAMEKPSGSQVTPVAGDSVVEDDSVPGGDGHPPTGDDDDEPRFHFTNITAPSGIDMTLTSGGVPATQILEVKGAGLALFDYDRDGRLDLFVPNGATLEAPEQGPGWRLYRNLGVDEHGNPRFEDVSIEAGINQTRWALGASVADYDGDGHVDIYVTCYGPNVLLRNTGDGRFEDVTEAAGVAGHADGWSTSASFGDVSGNGFLDLYVANYLEFDAANPPPPTTFLGMQVLSGPRGMTAQSDVLYRNRAADDGARFEDVSITAGIRDVTPSFGLGAVVIDVDQDGRQDIYVGNDSMPNFLFHNRRSSPGEMRLVDVGLASGIATDMNGNPQATMGIAIGDVNDNGLPDFFTTNFSSDTNTLHVNVGALNFDDRTSEAGLGVISRPFLGWSAGFLDLDLDGRDELLMVNGHVYPQATQETMDSEYRQPPLLFARGFGKLLRFERVTAAEGGAWLDAANADRAMVAGDLDRDGDLDLVIGAMNAPIRVLRNDALAAAEPGGNWLVVQLRDDRAGQGNRFGIGSRIELLAGASRQTRWVTTGGFLSANPLESHFGVPEAVGPIRLRITWPDGGVQEISNVAPGRAMTIEREGSLGDPTQSAKESPGGESRGFHRGK